MATEYRMDDGFSSLPVFAFGSVGHIDSVAESCTNKSLQAGYALARAAIDGYVARAGSHTVWFEVGGENLTYQDGINGLTVSGGLVTSLILRNDAGRLMVSITGFTPVDAAQFYQAMAGDNSTTAYQMLVSLSAGATVISGSDVANGAVAGTGNDTADMGKGDDLVVKFDAGDLVYDGGAGSDWLSFAAEFGDAFPTPPVQQLVVDLTTGTGQNPYGGVLQLTSVENIVGTPNADMITGSDAANIIGDAITETAGDVINALGGDDVIGFFSFAGFLPQLTGAKIDGGAGTDTLVFQYDQKGNALDLADQSNNAGMFRASTFVNMERFVVGSDFSTSFGDLVFKGDDSAQYLEVRQGQLTIDLGGGDDVLRLASANTSSQIVAEGGAGSDRLVFNAAAALNVLDLANPANNNFALRNGKFSGFEIFELATDGSAPAASSQLDFRGDANESTVIGGAGADFFRGAGGADVLIGGAGGDTYIFSAGDGNDTIIDVGFGETDTLQFLNTVQTDVTLTRSGNDLLVGVNVSGETIRVTDHFLGGARGLEKIGFAGGSSFDRQQILDHLVGAAPDASPTVAGPLVNVGFEGSGIAIIDLLAGASDGDSDALAVANVGGLGPGMSVVGNTLHVDRSAAGYDSYNAGGNRNFQVTYDIVDGRGGSVSQKATIAVTGVNDAAVIGGDTTGTVTRNDKTTAYGFLSIADVDINTINGLSEARFKTQGPTALTYGTFSLLDVNAGLWTYQLDNGNAAVQAGQPLIDTIAVQAFDGTTRDIVIKINGATGPGPIPLVAHGDAYVVQQSQVLTSAAGSGVLFNDEGSSPLAASLVAGPSHGTLQLGADGAFTYTPSAGFNGIDDFTYRASDAGQFQDVQAHIHVVPVLAGATTTLNLLALSAEQQIAATYAAFFGRGADRLGFEFWVHQFETGLPVQGPEKLFTNIASSFGVSDEAKALYPFLANPFGASDGQIGAFLDGVYQNLFNRASDAAGLAYWTGQTKATLQAGQFVGSILVNIMSGAQDTAAGKDITTLMGRVAVGLDYVQEQQKHGTVWAGAADVTAATSLLAAVTADPLSVLVGIRNAEDLIASHA